MYAFRPIRWKVFVFLYKYLAYIETISKHFKERTFGNERANPPTNPTGTFHTFCHFFEYFPNDLCLVLVNFYVG